VVILSEDTRTFAHAHGESVAESMAQHSGMSHSGHHGHRAETVVGARVQFQHTFPAPGLYKIWGEFQNREGEVIRVDFVVRVR